LTGNFVVCAFGSIVIATVGCGTIDVSGRNKAIQGALDQAYGSVKFATGVMSLGANNLPPLRKAESAGLITLRQIPQDYWGGFFSRTQGLGSPFEVTATPKLLAVAVAASDPNASVKVLKVKVQEDKMDKVVTEEEYKGPLATPGEKHVLLLGLFRMVPTSAAKVLGSDFTLQEEQPFRFRCVLTYSEFKKEWSVVAIDAGTVNPEQWLTNNVK
jgi:hypothetical protein